MSKRRVVVTGLGCLSPLGNDVHSTWDGILKGRSGVSKITAFDASACRSQISASIKNFNPELYGIDHKAVKVMDLFIQYGCAATIEAMKDSGLVIQQAERVGVAFGSGIGGLSSIENECRILFAKGPARMSPFFIPRSIINEVAGHISITHNAKGPNFSAVSACSTGSHNIGLGARTIAYGDADVMICGGSEMATCELGIGGFSAMRALSTRNDAPEKASRPWDKDRDGFVMGDGAATLILEEYEHAKKRGAKIYAELVGFGMSGDAFHIYQPADTGEGFEQVMNSALKDAQLSVEQIQYINAHGTSTPMGDGLEVLGIKRAFGNHAKKLAVSSTKSMVGHMIGAAGAIEALFSVLAIRDQVAPPTINLDNPSEDCDLDFVPHHARPMKIDAVLSNSFGFGGTNSTLIFKKID